MSCSRGIALLTIVVMLSGLIGLVAVCAFVMGNEADDDARYDETRERMLEVKRALIGRLADIGGGEYITSCGGFVSDYGEPADTGVFRIDDLLSNSEFADTPLKYETLFWAGYHGNRYLEVNAKDSVGNDTFIDGWGNSIEVSFHSGDTILIRSKGQDNILDEDDGDTTYYGKDIEDVFYWRRPLSVEVRNDTDITIRMNVKLTYPHQGVVQTRTSDDGDSNVAHNTTGTFNFTERTPVGLRKILVWDTERNDTEITTYCIPPGKDTDIVEIRYEG